jgi:hypothetical protein
LQFLHQLWRLRCSNKRRSVKFIRSVA